MRFVNRDPVNIENPAGRTLELNSTRMQKLVDWLQIEIENALSDHTSLERSWNRARRHYYGVPEHETRDIPYLNASNRVAPLAQIASDAIFATVFSITTEASPIITVRATNDKYAEHAKAIQVRIDAEINAEGEATTGGLHWNFLPALYHGGKDCVKLGTAFWHIGWFEQVVKGRYARTESAGARIEPVPIENVLVPGAASYDLQNLPWLAIRYEIRNNEMEERAKREKWNITGVHASGGVSVQRQERERFSRQTGNATRDDVNDIYRIYVNFDIDGDNEGEDLLVHYNHTGSTLLKVEWAPYDHRPGVVAHFDIEEFLFFGRGVPTILSNMTEIASDALNHWIDNGFLANCRMFKGPPTATQEDTIAMWPGRYIASNDADKMTEFKMSDVHETLPELLQLAIGFGERATGINDLSTARPAQIPGRTPATTTLQMLSQVSQRHTPFFASFRAAAACLVRECLYREQERLLRGDARLLQYLEKALGPETAALYVEALRDSTFDNGCTIELTITSAQMNQEVERQNAMLLFNIYRQYVTELVQSIILISQPQVNPVLRDVVQKAIIAGNEFMERLLRTFSSVTNPKNFIIDPTQEISQLAQQPQNILGQLAAQLGLGGENGVAQPSGGSSNGSQQPAGVS